MKHKKVVIILVVLIIGILGSLYVIGANHLAQDEQYGRNSNDPEVRMIYATIDGMQTRYRTQDPIVECSTYTTCSSSSQYDYIMNGRISLVNEYGSRIIHSFSAYLVYQGGQYYVVDSTIY